MNTEYTFLYMLLIVYMTLNVLSDITKLKTYNLWHLIFLIFLFLYGFKEGQVMSILISLFIIMVVGFLLSKIPGSNYGAGDFKMLAICSMFLSLMHPNQTINRSILEIVLFTTCYFVISFVITFICRCIQKSMKVEKMNFGTFKITKSYIETPEAVSIFIVCTTTIMW